MLLVVFDEARGRTRRLVAMQRITEGITGAQQYGHIVDRALEELKYGMRVRGSWFRLVESGHLVATHAAGMTSDFLRDAGFAEISDSVSKILEHPGAQVTSRNDAGHEPKEALQHEKIRQVVTVPVLGGKAPVGLLMLGNCYGRQWTAEELEFLQACAKQIALGVENFRLL
jgi:GAF domain-containing protein